MNLPAHYAAMRAAALQQFAQGAADLDPLLDAPNDTRRGLTLLARPAPPLAAAIVGLLAELRRTEPAQYYYPAADLHLTVLSLISCYPGFTLAAIEPEKYRRLVAETVQDILPFTVTLAGLTASPGGILVQGFPTDGGLELLRARLREAFRASGLPQSIDQRYSLQTAHLTVVRFRRPLLDYRPVVEFIEKYQQHFIGAFKITQLEVVFNDWYQRSQHTKLLATCPLPTGSQQP
ncbi:MAG: 2'-5' RNA ligase family protein [Janthinobacterium lividum]